MKCLWFWRTGPWCPSSDLDLLGSLTEPGSVQTRGGFCFVKNQNEEAVCVRQVGRLLDSVFLQKHLLSSGRKCLTEYLRELDQVSCHVTYNSPVSLPGIAPLDPVAGAGSFLSG